MLCIIAPILPVLLFMTYKIAKMVLPHEKEVVIMLILLCLTLISEIALWTTAIYSRLDPKWCCRLGSSCEYVTAIVCRAPSILLGNAIIFNMYKWRYFKLKVNAYIRIYLQQDVQGSEKNGTEDSFNVSPKTPKTSDIIEQNP